MKTAELKDRLIKSQIHKHFFKKNCQVIRPYRVHSRFFKGHHVKRNRD